MIEHKSLLETPVRYLKGVGPSRTELLKKLNIEIVKDLLFYLPRRYEDRSNFKPISKLEVGKAATIKGEILTFSARKARSGMSIFELAIGDKTGVISGIWFNQPFMKRFFKVGQKIIIYGKVERYDKLQINQPEYEIVTEEEDESIHVGRIVPIYHLTQDVSQRYLRGLVSISLDKYARFLDDVLPTNIRAKNKIADLRFAVRNIHFPATFDSLAMAHRRLVFEEFFVLQLALALKRKVARTPVSGIAHNLAGELINAFEKSIPFQLTDGQKMAIDDIKRDMGGAKPMNRLVEGDVGSGKTIVAAYGLTLTVQNGFQGVIMAPTEVLAKQHYLTLSEILMPLGVDVKLLISEIDAEPKNKLKDDIKNGQVDIIVGTHALIQEDVEFKKLGLVVIDEQHKFGVSQRFALREKGHNPHVLVMTATPIPRTLALTIYGDMDISIIKELPKGRKPIVTYWVDEDKREEIYEFIKSEVIKKRQAYIIYPLIEDSDKIHSKSATQMYEHLRKDVFDRFKLGLIHGKMSAKEKDEIMRKFKKGDIDVLVSTVVIEVGIDVSNATAMLIENAERFGLSQLHQLRGRIGRGQYESYCILMANPKTDTARKRLKAISESQDGFEIAQEDLELRGPGEFFGTRQHGLSEMRFANILTDMDILEQARKEAFSLIQRDPRLSQPPGPALKKALEDRFKETLEFIKVG